LPANKILRKTLWLAIAFEVIIGLLFYILFRPTILFFTLLNIKVEQIVRITGSILINSIPSFLSGSIILFFLRLITIKYKTSLIHLLVLTISLQVLTELTQLFFPKYSTPDIFDILFSVVGSFISYFIIIKATKMESQDINNKQL
jgi:VanZ family protein